jgi:hypothetical protein
MTFKKGEIPKGATPFKEGNDSRRNTTGANKGSRWNSSLLKDLMTVKLVGKDLEAFKELKEKYPKIFRANKETNLQLFMELKQISLVFSDDDGVSQRAIEAIKK